MQNHCWAGLIPEMEVPVEVDTILRASAACAQVTVEKVRLIGWVDLTKLGVLGQKDINKIGVWCEKLIAKNPLGCWGLFQTHLITPFVILLFSFLR